MLPTPIPSNKAITMNKVNKSAYRIFKEGSIRLVNELSPAPENTKVSVVLHIAIPATITIISVTNTETIVHQYCTLYILLPTLLLYCSLFILLATSFTITGADISNTVMKHHRDKYIRKSVV